MQRSLVSVAQFEFRALLQEARRAVAGLKTQRASVLHAVEAARQAHAAANQCSDEAAAQLARLVRRLECLDAALEVLAMEIEAEDRAALPAPDEYTLILPMPEEQAAGVWPQLRNAQECFVKVFWRKVAPFLDSYNGR
jgi:hypothetical protein